MATIISRNMLRLDQYTFVLKNIVWRFIELPSIVRSWNSLRCRYQLHYANKHKYVGKWLHKCFVITSGIYIYLHIWFYTCFEAVSDLISMLTKSGSRQLIEYIHKLLSVWKGVHWKHARRYIIWPKKITYYILEHLV